MSDARSSFGVFVQQHAPWPTLLARARRAEAMGFDTVWVADHFVNPYAPKADWFDGWTLLAALAASTTTVRLGPLVASVTLRHPALLARAAMTVDHISGGRLELGIGPAGAPFDYSMLGLPAWPPRERVDRLGESLAIVIPLLERGVVHHAGRYHVIDEAFVAPLPVQRPRPPITVGALGMRAIEVAARHAGTWNTYGVSAGRSIVGSLTHEDAVATTAARARLADAAPRRAFVACAVAVAIALAGCGTIAPTPASQAPSRAVVVSPVPTASAAVVASPAVVCDTSQFQPPPSLTCAPAIAAALAALGPAHPPTIREEFRWGGLCPPGAPCAPPLGSAGIVIFDFATGPSVFVYVNAEAGGAVAPSSPAPYPSGY